jgi:thymidylate synthase ThyX
MTTQRAEVICDSIGEHSPRLTTFKLRYHRFIHSEFMTHRMLSRNASSSRAVPVAKLIAEVRDDATRAAPVWWGAEQKGMQSGGELSNERYATVTGDPMNVSPMEAAQLTWKNAALQAAGFAQAMVGIGVHKSIVNRILEPFSHINVIATGVEDAWLNFFGLRLDKAAQPEMRALAELMWAAWQASTPRKLTPGQWHLPFVDQDALNAIQYAGMRAVQLSDGDISIRVSVARCARVSYESFETGKRSTVEEDLKLYERLMGSQPLHASPAEHQATVDAFIGRSSIMPSGEVLAWKNPQQHGNLHGWRQYRKMLPGERIAPLPEGYVYKNPR